MSSDIDIDTLLSGLDGQPEEVRRLFIYAVCETMVLSGSLEFVGAGSMPTMGTTLLYRNPETGDVFEILKPDIQPDDEARMHEHIQGLLASQV